MLKTSLKAAHSSIKALEPKWQWPSWDSAAPLRPLARVHPKGGVGGSCGSGYSFRTQHSPSVPQSTMLSTCWSVCNAKTSIREHGHCLTVLGPYPFRSRSMTTIRSLSSSDIVITQIDLPSVTIGLWSIMLAMQGLRSIYTCMIGTVVPIFFLARTVGSITASLSDHQVSRQRLDLHMLSNIIRLLHMWRYHQWSAFSLWALIASPSTS